MSLLDSLLRGRELDKAPPKSSPSSPARATTERPVRPASCSWNDLRDAYGRRANVALDAICEASAPEGLIVWLGEHSPFLYGRLTQELPNAISHAWDARIPYEDFDALCFDLVDTYRRAAELYRATAEERSRRTRT